MTTAIIRYYACPYALRFTDHRGKQRKWWFSSHRNACEAVRGLTREGWITPRSATIKLEG